LEHVARSALLIFVEEVAKIDSPRCCLRRARGELERERPGFVAWIDRARLASGGWGCWWGRG
jgi:hypothetical protein